MKKIYGFAFAAAVMALASCSNDNEPVINPNPTPGEGELSYVAFNIATPAGTRADNFEDGKDFENAAEAATFLFFNADGTLSQIPQTVQLSWLENSATENPAVEKISNAIVAVAGRDNGDNLPKEVLVVLNDPGVNFVGKTKDEILKELAAADQVYSLKYNGSAVSSLTKEQFGDDKNVEGKFIMTNSTYLADGTVITATPIDQSQLYSSRAAAAAAANKVNIFVERLAARVNLVPKQGFDTTPTEAFQVNGVDSKIILKPVIKGVEIANVAQSEYYFKHIESNWSLASLYDPANYRTNWAVMPENVELGNKSYNEYTTNLEDLTFYVTENTLANEEDSQITKKTCVLLTAELVNTETNKGQDLVRWAGLYFTPETFQTQGLNFLKKFYVKTVEDNTTAWRNLTADDVNFTYVSGNSDNGMAQYESALQVTLKDGVDAANLVVGNTEDAAAATLDDLNAELMQKENRCWYWNAGMTYYFVEIGSGNGTFVNGENEDDSTFATGVVRNNAYQINLNSLAGLGVPVYNPDDKIIPQTPKEDLFYVGAQINILKWRMVSQPADIEQVPL